MRIHELFEGTLDNFPNDGKGNIAVWDPHQRMEVLVPIKDAEKMIASKQIIGGALNLKGPSRYPVVKGTNFTQNRIDTSIPQDDPKPDGAWAHFKQGFKQGYKGTRNRIQDFEYTPVGKAVTGLTQFAKRVNKGPPIK